MDNQRKCFKVAESIYHVWITKENVYKVAECIYHVWIIKEKVLKLRGLYLMCGSQKKMFLSWGIYISCLDHQAKF